MNNKINNNINEDSMLANLDRVMRQLRRRPKGSNHVGRGTYRLLKTISEFPGISTRDLSEALEIRQASLNEKLMKLENEGLIKREKDIQDGRIRVVYLEVSGVEHLKRSQEYKSKINDSIATILNVEEIQIMSSLAKKLAIGLEAINIEVENHIELNQEKGGN